MRMLMSALCDRSRRLLPCYVHPLIDAGGYARHGCAWRYAYAERVALAHVEERKKSAVQMMPA